MTAQYKIDVFAFEHPTPSKKSIWYYVSSHIKINISAVSGRLQCNKWIGNSWKAQWSSHSRRLALKLNCREFFFQGRPLLLGGWRGFDSHSDGENSLCCLCFGSVLLLSTQLSNSFESPNKYQLAINTNEVFMKSICTKYATLPHVALQGGYRQIHKTPALHSLWRISPNCPMTAAGCWSCNSSFVFELTSSLLGCVVFLNTLCPEEMNKQIVGLQGGNWSYQ